MANTITEMLEPSAEERERWRRQQALSILGMGMGTRSTMGVGQMLNAQAEEESQESLKSRLAQHEAQQRSQERRQAQENWQRSFDENKRQFGIEQEDRERRRNEPDPFKVYRGEDTLRGDYQQDMSNITGSLSAVEKVEAFLPHNLGRMPNPAEQQGMVIGLNKMTDPTSVVRESEYARTQEGQGLLSRAENYAEMIRSGRFLSKEMLDDIGQMTAIYRKLAQERGAAISQRYGEIATRRGYDPQNIVDRRYLPREAEDEPPPGAVRRR